VTPRKVSIIILTWNGLSFTRTCLATLRAFTASPPYEVIVVDNGSTDGTCEFVAGLPWVRLIRNAENLGFVRGNNIGIAAADPASDCVLFNNDVEICQPDWLARMQAAAYSRPRVGIVGCRQLRPGGRLLHAGAYMPVETMWGQQIGGLEKDVNQYATTREVESVSFGCVYLTRAVLKDIGGLDEDYFSYFEDTDYCLKAREKGWAVLCCGEATVIHHENVSTRVNRVDFSRLFDPSRATFRRKWEAKLRAAYRLPLVWHSTASRPLGYAVLSRAIIDALEDQKVLVAYRYVYGPGTPFPLEEPPDLGDYRLNIMAARPAPADQPQIVLAQGDAFERNYGAYKIGFSMLEVDGLPPEWVRQANLMDEVWVPSPFNLETFRASGVRRPIHVVPLGIDPNHFHPTIRGFRLDDRFTFLANFEWGERKAPEILLRAFNEEFSADDDAVLIVKCVNTDPAVDVRAQIRALGLRADGGRIEVVLDRLLPTYQLGSLYRSADCFVSTSRGEGWGMPILEAMACGLPVIATDWSAPRSFMHEGNAYPLRVRRLVPAVAKCPYYEGFRWAEPDEEHLRHLLRWVYEHREEARARGEQAAAETHARFTWGHTAERIVERLREIGAPSVAPRAKASRNAGRLAVGIDVSRAIGEATGVGVYARMLAKALALVDRDTQYVLYPGFGPFVHPEYPERARLEIDLPSNFRIYRGSLPAFAENGSAARALDGPHRVDVVHSTGNTAPDVDPARLVMTVHDLTFRLLPEYHTPENVALCERGMRDAITRARAFIATSECTKADLMRLYGVETERIHVVHPGIDPRFAPADAHAVARVRARHGLARPYVLFLGSNEPRKNLARLIEAYDRVRRRPGLAAHELVVAGAAGWLNGDVAALVRRLGIETDVRFLGYVPAEDQPALYSGADVFAYPSLYEGFGIPVAEAMACGAPVLTSNVSSLPEVAGGAALLVDPRETDAIADALVAVLSDDGLRASLRARGLERARAFSLERMGRETLQVYERVAAC